MLKLGVLLEACGIKCTDEQVNKLESFVNYWLKKYYISKKDNICEEPKSAEAVDKSKEDVSKVKEIVKVILFRHA